MTFPGDAATRIALQRYKFPWLSIDCGDYTYGQPNLMITESDAPRILKIGRYCSIARDCMFFVGRHGRHHLTTLTTYPIGMTIAPEIKKGIDFLPPPSLPTDLDLIIGNDVWIGTRAIIMAGITIGDGAVIAAGSVVTKNVESYSIVGGTPAKHIRYRHNLDICKRLQATHWWKYSPNELAAVLGPYLSSGDMSEVLRRLESAVDR